MRWLDSITYSVDMNLGKLRDSKGQASLACCIVHGVEKRHDLEAEPNI